MTGARTAPVLAAAVLALTACTTSTARVVTGGGSRPMVSGPIVIDADAGETFRPEPGLRTHLTAAQAWRHWARLSHEKDLGIPSELTVRKGRLTEAPQYAGKPVFAFTRPAACASMNPNVAPPKHCVEWTFLGALAGNFVAQTYRVIS